MTELAIHNPATGERIAGVPADDLATVAIKAARARAAQPAWAATPLAERLACIGRFRDGVVRELEALAVTMTRETGKPIRVSRNELNGLLPRIDFFMQQTRPCIATETVHDEGGMREQIEHLPLGVVANISAWNYPWFVGCNVIVPALLTGNAVLYKPSEYATLTGLEIARLLHQAGVPRDVLAVLVGDGAVGAALLEQTIDGLFFTGSYATGARIGQALSGRLVKLQLELGGKDPTYVCEDADPKTAAQSLADGAMYNTGQSCCSVERIYVHDAIVGPFVEAFVETVRGFVLGDPEDPATYIGPLARSQQIAVLEHQIRDAVEKGARVLCGGKRAARGGNYFEPTVLGNVTTDMAVMREESFGPIIGIEAVPDDATAIARMNDTDFGLTAGVYTRDRARATAILARVNAGSVYWNCCDRVSPRLPWTGRKHSGLGSTLSKAGIAAFLQPKAWHLRSS